jgi:hypothetical protein
MKFASISVGIVLLALGTSPAIAQARRIGDAAAQIESALTTGNLDAFLAHCTNRDVLFCYRYMAWNLNAADVSKGRLLELPGERGVWTEAYATFQKSDRGSDEFRKVFREFCGIFKDSTFIEISKDEWDTWKMRRPGLVLKGKIASNAHWFIYFVRESNEWKAWKIEVEVH